MTTRQKILEKAVWNKATGYQDQLTYTFEDGYEISVPRTKEGMTRFEIEDTLVEAVKERLGIKED